MDKYFYLKLKVLFELKGTYRKFDRNAAMISFFIEKY